MPIASALSIEQITRRSWIVSSSTFASDTLTSPATTRPLSRILSRISTSPCGCRCITPRSSIGIARGKYHRDFTGPSFKLRSSSLKPNTRLSSPIFSSSFISALPSRSISSSLRLPLSIRRIACFSSKRRTNSTIDSTSFASPFSTISGSAAMRSGMTDSVNVSACRNSSSSFVISIGEHFQRPPTRKQEWCTCLFQLCTGLPHVLDFIARNEQRQLERLLITMRPSMLQRERHDQSLRFLTKARIDRGGVRRFMQRAQILRAACKHFSIGTLARRSRRDFERHLDIAAIRIEHTLPSRELRRLDFARERVAVADGDERRALQQLRANARDAQQQLAIADWLIVGDVDRAEKKLAGRNRRRSRLDIFATKMHADGDVLHRLLTRATASTLARMTFNPR